MNKRTASRINLFSYVCAVIMLMTSMSVVSHAQSFTAATFNLRYQTASDSGNLWVNRLPMVTSLIRFHGFDVFGTQEGLRNQLTDIVRSLPEYTFYGAGRDDGMQTGEHSAIFFRKDRFKLMDKGDFWLSETPDQPSLGWDATCCNRICSWVLLNDLQTGKDFYFFNAHYDHQGIKARLESSKLILQRIREIAGGNAVILTGDLNGDQKSEWYETITRSGLLRDTYSLVNFPYANNGTFNGFGRSLQSDRVIDHVFVSEHFLISRWGILSDSFHGKFPSDHFPVLADIVQK